jgi:heme-degrading monooxygenase HmoA
VLEHICKGISAVIEIIWEFVVKEEFRGQFELAYGRGGAWSKLFGRAPGFRGTTLLRDADNPQRYLTVDVWDSEADRTRALDENAEEYSRLDADFAEWTETERELGIFRMLAEAAVRPRGGSRSRRSSGRRAKPSRLDDRGE